MYVNSSQIILKSIGFLFIQLFFYDFSMFSIYLNEWYCFSREMPYLKHEPFFFECMFLIYGTYLLSTENAICDFNRPTNPYHYWISLHWNMFESVETANRFSESSHISAANTAIKSCKLLLPNYWASLIGLIALLNFTFQTYRKR